MHHTPKPLAELALKDLPDLVVRPPAIDEIDRAAYLFRHGLLRPQSELLVAVRSRPVERFVGAAAWWAEGAMGRFHLVRQRGIPCPGIFGHLVNAVVKHSHTARLQRLQYADLLTETDECRAVLVEKGFEPQGANRFFEAGCDEAAARVRQLFAKHANAFPSGWRTESIRHHQQQMAFELIAGHGLLPPGELELYWQGNNPGGFDLESSSFLFACKRPCGVLLTRVVGDTFFVDVRVVNIENRYLRALGNLLLFHHMTERWNAAGPVIRLQFHGGAAEHRETANLALRMGGRELPSRHIYAKTL